MNPKSILIAVAAGLAAALLFAGIVLQSSSAVILALAAPIPIAIAGLGWGGMAGFVAAFSAAGFIFLVSGSAASAGTLLVSMALPTALGAYLANLAKPRETGPVAAAPILDWYPLERVLFALTLSAAGACILIGAMIGYDPAEMAPAVIAAFTAQQSPVDPELQAAVEQFASFMVELIPYVQPAIMLLTLVAGLYLAAAVTRISGRLPRPRDDVPASASLPRAALAVAAVGFALSLLDGNLGLVGAVIVGTFAAAFTLVGLAGLHRRTRGRPGRGLILFASYAAILLLSFPLAFFALFGALETFRRPAVAAGSGT